jgi:hypothetical protein
MKEIQLLGLLLCVVILILCFVKIFKEGFAFNIDQKNHDEFSLKYQKKYGNIGTMLISSKNESALGSSTRDIFGSVQDTIDESNNLSQTIDDPHLVEGGVSGMSLIIKQCEAVKTADCSAFDKPEFSKNCSVCLDIGTNSEGKPQTGGLVLIPKDKTFGKGQQKGNFLAPYNATVGSCPAGMLVANKAECVRLQNELACKKGGTMDKPTGCSQCFETGTYHVVDPSMDPALIIGTGILMIIGSGTLTWSESGTSNTGTVDLSPTNVRAIPLAGAEYSAISLNLVGPPIPKPYDSSKIYRVNDLIIFNELVYRMQEGAGAPGYDPSRQGDRLWANIIPYTQYVPPPPTFIAGYLQAPDGNSFQSMDLYRLIMSDSITGRKPRTMGEKTVEGVDVTKMGPGYGKNIMRLTAYSPFTFVDNLSQEASLCTNSPFLTKAASAKFISSDPCYAKGAGPGTYNLACLQQTFKNNGCGLSADTLNKTGFPDTPEKAAGLMSDTNGRVLKLDEIANKIYEYAVASATGLDSTGTKLTINNWSAASLFCTGVPINSPCDSVDEDGKLTDDCIVYLWDNQGENKIPKGTYSLSSLARSLFDTGRINRFCTRDGTYAPKDSSNKLNRANLTYWKNMGTVEAVKAAMSQLHLDANTSLTTEDAKAAFIKQCYGIVPNPRPTFKSDYKSVKGVNKMVGNTILKNNITLPKNYDYSLSFDITPYGVISNNYGGIIRVTSRATRNGFPPGYGERNPLIIFDGRSTIPYIIFGDNGPNWWDWNWWGAADNANNYPALPLNKKSTISIRTSGRTVTVTVAGVTKTFTQPSIRMHSRTPDETYTFMASDNIFPVANAMIENINYTVNGATILQTPPAPPADTGPGQSM